MLNHNPTTTCDNYALDSNHDPTYKVIFLELKDTPILSSIDDIRIPKNTMRSMFHCTTTKEYQCSRIDFDQYVDRLTQDFGYPQEQVKSSLLSVRKSTTFNESLLDVLTAARTACHDRVRFFATTNMFREEYASANDLGLDWSLFDRVFLSSDLGMHKPELRFYEKVLLEIVIPASEAVLINLDPDSVLAALSLGFQDVPCLEDHLSRSIFQSIGLEPRCSEGAFCQQQQDLQSSIPLKQPNGSLSQEAFSPTEAIIRGTQFLKQNAKDFSSYTSPGMWIDDNFAQLVTLEITGDPDLVNLDVHRDTWNYFIGEPVLTQANFPDDVDTTSLGTIILDRPRDIANRVMDKVLEYLSPDGIVQTFFTDYKNRVDPFVCCNALSLFYQYGRGEQLTATLDWVQQVLQRRAYMYGSSYYPGPETFLFFLSRLLRRLEDRGADCSREIRSMLIERAKERIGVEADAPALAMRLLTSQQLGIRDVQELRSLMAMQEDDGGWESGTLYSYASKKLRIGNRGTSSAFAIDAISRCRS